MDVGESELLQSSTTSSVSRHYFARIASLIIGAASATSRDVGSSARSEYFFQHSSRNTSYIGRGSRTRTAAWDRRVPMARSLVVTHNANRVSVAPRASVRVRVSAGGRLVGIRALRGSATPRDDWIVLYCWLTLLRPVGIGGNLDRGRPRKLSLSVTRLVDPLLLDAWVFLAVRRLRKTAQWRRGRRRARRPWPFRSGSLPQQNAPPYQPRAATPIPLRLSTRMSTLEHGPKLEPALACARANGKGS
jgi:hypothetical protein